MTGKKNGRGAYLCRSSDCLKKARKSKGLERSFKMCIPNEVMISWKRSLRSLKQNKILSLLGLATRASAVSSGEFMTEKAVKEGRARLVIVGTDASDNTKKNFLNMCTYYHVPCFFYATRRNWAMRWERR